jgi:hypothetical protein
MGCHRCRQLQSKQRSCLDFPKAGLPRHSQLSLRQLLQSQIPILIPKY